MQDHELTYPQFRDVWIRQLRQENGISRAEAAEYVRNYGPLNWLRGVCEAAEAGEALSPKVCRSFARHFDKPMDAWGMVRHSRLPGDHPLCVAVRDRFAPVVPA